MNRSEFLNELRIALQGEISQANVNENLRYYENYIIEESRKGRSEEDIIVELGNPRLIAKTIIETTDQLNTDNSVYEEAPNQNYSSGSYEDGRTDGFGGNGNQHPRGFHVTFDETSGWDVRYGRFKINSWYGTLLIILIVLLFFFLLANIAIILIPIVIPVILVGVILYLFFGKRK